MGLSLSKRISRINFSPIRKFNKYALQAEEAGKKIYHLNIGQPDIPTPPAFMEAVRNFDSKVVAYEESDGNTELVDAVRKFYRHYGADLNRGDIIVTTGGSEALNMTFSCILDPGDEVLIPEPYYSNYSTFIISADGVLKPIPTQAETGYTYADEQLIESRITDKTKAICLTAPGNPTGTALSREDMELICGIAKRHDLWIVADEVYREFVFDGAKPASFTQLPEYADRVIVIDSISKRFSACGARIGFVISKNKEFMDAVLKLAEGRLSVSTIDQAGAAALYSLPDSFYREMREKYESRRDAVYEELMKIPGVQCEKPHGAFYATVTLPVDDAEDFLMFLLTEFDDNGETVMFAPAKDFFVSENLGNNKVRVAYVLEPEALRRAVQLIGLGLEAYKHKK
ncbi:MAG: pyridoxal phosphate-dependent aminotransferase [Eubacteriales bacterium]|nr:pyridoxal phosphate-dependent aminotransferase [Eubacteriales bacterium]